MLVLASWTANLKGSGIDLQAFGNREWWGMRAGAIQFISASMVLLSTAWADIPGLHPDLLEQDAGYWYQRDRSDSPLGVASSVVCIQLNTGVQLPIGEEIIRAWGGLVYDRLESVQGIVAEVPAADLVNLSSVPIIRWIEPVLPPLTATANEMRECSGIDIVQNHPWSLDGTGIRLGQIEVDFPSNTHPDLTGRMTYHSSGSAGGHPTHVAGIMAGDGTSSGGLYRGVATNAKIDAHLIDDLDGYLFFTNPGNLESIYAKQHLLGGAAAVNQSMGINVGANGYPCWLLGDYGMTSAVLDEIVRGSQGEPFVSVWSAGNERSFDTCPDLYGTISSPAGAKNIITVGAVYSNTSNTTWFSSWGPTDDGRLKPDVVAAGSQLGGDGGITSCKQLGGYEVRSGTSMSAPVVTGVVGLMRQVWNESMGNATPPLPSTYKAILCHTAEDGWNAGPDYRTGWGLVQAEAAIALMSERTWQQRSIGSSGIELIPFEVTDSSTPLRITIAWDDPAAQPGNNAGLVNDLDLLLQAPDGTLHFPWTLDPMNPESAAVRTKADRNNPIEQVLVDVPVPGSWNVIVTASTLAGDGHQIYSLVSEPPLPITILQIDPLPEYIPLDGLIEISVDVATIGEAVVPGTAKLLYRIDDDMFQSTDLLLDMDGRYRAGLSDLPCGSTVSFYVSLESTVSGVHTLPTGGSADPFLLQVGPSLETTFMDSFDEDQGWTTGGTATEGHWTRSVPTTECNWMGEPNSDAEPDSTMCMLTEVNLPLDCGDVDNGCVELISPRLDALGADVRISYARFFISEDDSWPYTNDRLVVSFSVDDGMSWHVLETVNKADDTSGQWTTREWFMDTVDNFVPTDELLLKFVACDYSNPTDVEAAVDAVRIEQNPCADLEPTCIQDLVGNDGLVDIQDLLRMLAGYGLDDPVCDLDQDGDVDIEDLLSVLNAWGTCD